MNDKLRILLGVVLIIFVAFMITYSIISMTITKGIYSYHEIELRTTSEDIEFGVIILHENIWEKEIDSPVGIYKEKMNVYYEKDNVVGIFELEARDTTIYQIGDKYYYKINLLQRAF